MKVAAFASALLLAAGSSALQVRRQDAQILQHKEVVASLHAEAEKFSTTHVGDHYAAIEERMQTMSQQEAIEELKRRGAPEEMLVMVQDLLSSQGPIAPSQISKAFKAVIDKINEMISYVQMEYDVAELTCRSALEDLRSEIAGEEHNMDAIEAHLGETQSNVISWNNRKDEAEKNMRRVTEELEAHRAWCAREMAATQETIRINTNDYTQAQYVYSQTLKDCQGKKDMKSPDARPTDKPTQVSLLEEEVKQHTDAKGEVLLRCVNWMGRSFVTFERPEVAKAVLSMTRERHSKLHTRITQSLLGQAPANATKIPTVADSASDPVGLVIPDALQNAGCTDKIGDMTSDKFKELCIKVRESIAELVDQVNYELNLQKQYLAELQRNCSNIEKDLNDELAAYNEIKRAAESRIAGLTARYTQLQTDQRVAFANYQQRSNEFRSKLDDCKASFAQAITGACAAKTIKKQISLISASQVNPIVECQVTAWNENLAMCSASCGKDGVKKLTRKVSVQPTEVWGAPCPALTAERVCNRVTCPVDCVVGAWQPFTPCSAKCNTGTKFRYKEVLVEPRYKGAACGDMEGLEFCNQEACDQDCELYPWTDFSVCDRACGTGHKSRTRPIKKDKKGDGFCPVIRDDRRLEVVKCNAQDCPEVKPVCQSKLDVILLIDTSGSLGEDGFKSAKQFAKDFVAQLKLSPANVAVGVVAFSDKPYIVQPLSTNAAEVQKAIDTGILWDAGLTATASALAMAGQLLDNGARAGAMPVVIAVTDGMPTGVEPEFNEWWDTPDNAEKLRARARVMFLAVGPAIEEADMMSWATDGGEHNNYAHIADYSVLNKAIDELVISSCPEIKPAAPATTAGSSFLAGKSFVDASMRASYNNKGIMWGKERKVFLATQPSTNPLSDISLSDLRY